MSSVELVNDYLVNGKVVVSKPNAFVEESIVILKVVLEDGEGLSKLSLEEYIEYMDAAGLPINNEAFFSKGEFELKEIDGVETRVIKISERSIPRRSLLKARIISMIRDVKGQVSSWSALRGGIEKSSSHL